MQTDERTDKQIHSFSRKRLIKKKSVVREIKTTWRAKGFHICTSYIWWLFSKWGSGTIRRRNMIVVVSTIRELWQGTRQKVTLPKNADLFTADSKRYCLRFNVMVNCDLEIENRQWCKFSCKTWCFQKR